MEKFSAKIIFKDIKNFLAGRFLGNTRDEFLLEELIKLIFCKYIICQIDTHQYNELELSKLYRKTFKNVVNSYPDIYENNLTEIEFDPISIKYIDTKLNSLDINNLERDLMGEAYEIFIGDSIKNQSGQFFTPQNAARALVEMSEIKPNDTILDLTCGAGSFLISALKYCKEHHIEMGNNNLFGIDKDSYLSRLTKIHIACLKNNSKNIRCADSLVWNNNILQDFPNNFDIILTNPPFGTNIKAGSIETLSKFELSHKYKTNKNGLLQKTDDINANIAPQVVFIEQCIKHLKFGGKLGIVVPESMISNKKYSYVVDFIDRNCNIKAIIGMPDDLFKISGKGGTHTKTCLLLLERKNNIDNANYPIFIAEAKWCGHDSRGRDILKDDIPQIVKNYKKYINNEKFIHTELGFIIRRNEINNNVLAPRAYLYKLKKTSDLTKTHFLVTINELINNQTLTISTGNEVGKLAYGTGKIPFVRTSDLSNWEIKSDPKHLVSNDIYNSLAEKQNIQEGDILMVKDGSYLIGTCAMITKNDLKMVYQSHLYKIRVNPKNKYNVDNFYLLAALSSEYVKKQIQTNTYSNDIINSLGDRIKNITIPINKEVSQINKISTMVQKTINSNMISRELSQKAKEEVLL